MAPLCQRILNAGEEKDPGSRSRRRISNPGEEGNSGFRRRKEIPDPGSGRVKNRPGRQKLTGEED
jgi:hypothetical protein